MKRNLTRRIATTIVAGGLLGGIVGFAPTATATATASEADQAPPASAAGAVVLVKHSPPSMTDSGWGR